jgi:hypothetical protein
VSSNSITDEIRTFIFERIDSVELLEILLLLWSKLNGTWTARAVSDHRRTNPDSTARKLESLVAMGLAARAEESPAIYRFDASSQANDELVANLAEVYRIRPHKVLELIFSPSKKARSFADAFLAKGPPKEDKSRE